MQWVVGLLLLVLVDLAVAQETPSPNPELAEQYALETYDQAIVRFNTNTKEFSSWDEFKAQVAAMVPTGTPGTCYALTGDMMKPVEITRVSFQGMQGKGWQQTSGQGWRQKGEDRTFVEYRINDKARLLLRIEGAKSFFFSQTKKICEFPL